MAARKSTQAKPAAAAVGDICLEHFGAGWDTPHIPADAVAVACEHGQYERPGAIRPPAPEPVPGQKAVFGPDDDTDADDESDGDE